MSSQLMNIRNIRSIFLIILIFILALIQVFFLSSSPILKGANLILCLIIILFVLPYKQKPIYLLGPSLIGGLILDLFSLFPFGFFILVFLSTNLFLSWLVRQIQLEKFISVAIFGVAANLTYYFFSIIVNQIFNLFKVSNILINFNYFYLSQIVQGLIINTLIISLAFFAGRHFKISY